VLARFCEMGTLETSDLELIMYRYLKSINQNEKNKVSSTLLSLRLDAQPTVTY
jgi:hypothetical protein